MDNFEVLKLYNETYDYLVIATSYENPLSFIDEIGEEIQVQRANLLFDLTLINGTSKNRYIQGKYEAGRNQLMLCSIVQEVSDSIKKVSQIYFAENEEVVRKSVIPNALKYLIRCNMV